MTESTTFTSSSRLAAVPLSKWLNPIFVILQRFDWPGKHRFYLWCVSRIGHRLISHNINGRAFWVPLGEWCFWLEKGPANYYLQEFEPFCALLSELNKPFTLFDLGADIGTVTSLVSSRCVNLSNIIAFEPNPRAFKVLQANLQQMSCLTTAVQSAVSNFDGMARLTADQTRVNDHEGHIIAAQDGDVTVASLDIWVKNNPDVHICKTLVVKIDVEGQEQQVLEGAVELMRAAETVVVLLEIHPGVLRDTATTPEELFSQAERIRKFTWIVPAVGREVDRERAFFEQFADIQYDVIGISSHSRQACQ